MQSSIYPQNYLRKYCWILRFHLIISFIFAPFSKTFLRHSTSKFVNNICGTENISSHFDIIGWMSPKHKHFFTGFFCHHSEVFCDAGPISEGYADTAKFGAVRPLCPFRVGLEYQVSASSDQISCCVLLYKFTVKSLEFEQKTFLIIISIEEMQIKSFNSLQIFLIW